MNTNKNRRMGLLINPRFQWRVVAHFAFSGLMITGFYFMAVHYFFLKFEKKGESMALPSDHVFFRFLTEQRLTMNWMFVLAMAGVILFSLVFGLYFSHKVSGPVARIQRLIQAWGDGTKVGPEFKFRKGDYFPELAATVEHYFRKAQPKKQGLKRVK